MSLPWISREQKTKYILFMRSKFSFLHVDGYNHGQNIVDKLAKLSKIGVSLE